MLRKRSESPKPRDCCVFRLDADEEGFIQCLERQGLLMESSMWLLKEFGALCAGVGALDLTSLRYLAIPLMRIPTSTLSQT